LLLEIVPIRRLGQFLQVSPPIMAAGLAVEEIGLFPINLGETPTRPKLEWGNYDQSGTSTDPVRAVQAVAAPHLHGLFGDVRWYGAGDRRVACDYWLGDFLQPRILPENWRSSITDSL